MNANAISVLNIFEKKLRLEIPLFQRQYVWDKEIQWEPLWEDISRKFTEYIDERQNAPVHFLGAIVLDQKQTPTTHVEKRQVIDGQQRLITLQIFLATLKDFCRKYNLIEIANECESFTFNKGMMADQEIDKFKVWPTQLDRGQFKDVMISGGLDELNKKHPLIRRKYAKKNDPRPKMIEAYNFFYNEIAEYFSNVIEDQSKLSIRLDKCFQALKNALYVVVIDLGQDDDPQIIFETLNARGEPLLPADLLRNYIFLRAAREGESQEVLYNEYWKGFDDPFWREEVRQGRLIRPRSDLFMQHFLASQQATDIPIKHLYVEYKWWIEREKPFNKIREELSTLAKQSKDFKRIIEPSKNDTLFSLSNFLKSFDISTVYPLMLYLFSVGINENKLEQIANVIKSYLLRRSVCNYTTKAYNRIFLSMIRFLKDKGTNLENIKQYLSELEGESGLWPTDEIFRKSWQTQPVYQTLNNNKIDYVFRSLNEKYLTNKIEDITIDGSLSIEHILPNNWIDNWPLPDGSKGMSYEELWDTQLQNDPRADATKKRNSLLDTFGNLTIITQPLNSSLSNSEWKIKKPALLQASLLPINQTLHSVHSWDEQTIESRSKQLFKHAIELWPGPLSTV